MIINYINIVVIVIQNGGEIYKKGNVKMHEIEEWIGKLFKTRVFCDDKSIKEFIIHELNNNPLEDSRIAKHIIRAVLDYNFSHLGYGILIREEIKYRKEKDDKNA